ncbi:hypothetical protein J7E63_15860 [Bacillus sp. ISL-75]|uniref:hypothetical protein n=1 Tax=Bacillus sp. ISL-75 TaxID=2819137 RepID=UPI001BE58977|nr:hypothetical protein [Bacillus sp. ISL-75]MBT2728405.1 hypothetical protein [Bacillus sp. ISL-75]
MTKTAKYLELFFDEKEIQYEAFEIDHNGNIHLIDTDVVIEAIKNAPAREQDQVANTLRKIDFANGNVNHFLKFLAEQFVKTQY